MPQLRHRKARNGNVRRIESSMLLVWDSRVLCQPHRGQLGRSGSVTASTSPFPQCRLPACPVLRIQIAVPGLCPFPSSNLRGHQTCKVTNLPSMVTFGGLITSRNLWHFTPVPVPRRFVPWFRIGARLDDPPCPQLPCPLSPLTATGRTLSRTCRSRWTASP